MKPLSVICSFLLFTPVVFAQDTAPVKSENYLLHVNLNENKVTDLLKEIPDLDKNAVESLTIADDILKLKLLLLHFNYTWTWDVNDPQMNPIVTVPAVDIEKLKTILNRPGNTGLSVEISLLATLPETPSTPKYHLETGLKKYGGLTYPQAVIIALIERKTPRIVMIDCTPLMVTQDFREDRINFSIFGGRVIAANIN